MPWFEDDLRLAEQHIERAQHIIARQQEIIIELEDGGHDVEGATTLLQTMRGALEAFRRHKAAIEEHLATRRGRSSSLSSWS